MLTTMLYSVAGGMLAVLASGKPNQLAWRFVRVVAMVALALACLPTFWRIREAGFSQLRLTDVTTFGIIAAASAAALLLLAPMCSRHRAVLRTLGSIGGTAGIIAACQASLAGCGRDVSSLLGKLIVVNQVLAAWLLGSMTLAWLLGHAYLTATKMTIAPLRHVSRVFSVSVWLRVAFLLGSVAMYAWFTRGGDPSPFALLARSWLIVGLRVGVGLIGVMVFAYMVADCVRLRATQSATGILYFGTLFAYIGELANQYLLREIGWPF